MGKNSGKRGRDGKLSVAIDPLLIEGGRTVSEIADVLVAQFGGEFPKPQVVNNIRSRMVVLTRRDKYTLEKDSSRRVRLVAPIAESVAPATPA